MHKIASQSALVRAKNDILFDKISLLLLGADVLAAARLAQVGSASPNALGSDTTRHINAFACSLLLLETLPLLLFPNKLLISFY